MLTIPPHKLHETARAKDLSCLRAYLESKQYIDRPDFWTGKKSDGEMPVPVRERAPCVVYPLPKVVANRVANFTFGETRFPSLCVESEDEEGSEGAEGALNEGMRALVESAGVRSLIYRAMVEAISCRTAVIALSIVDGRFVAEMPSAEHCVPTFKNGRPGHEVESLCWVYQYKVEEYDEKNDCVRTGHYWFRRDFTATAVIDYEPAPVKTGKKPEWKESSQTLHPFGVCPVLWIRNEPKQPSSVDGESIYAEHLAEFDALNLALSQRHRGINFFGSPQAWETGVAEDDGPQATGRTARSNYQPVDGKAPFGGVCTTGPARKLAPDQIWSYSAPDVKVGLIETTGKSFEVATLHVNDIKGRLSEAMQVVLTDPANLDIGGNGSLNAKLLAMLYAPMLALVDALRDSTWWPALRALVSLLLRMLAAHGGDGVELQDVDAAAFAKLLKRFFVTTTVGSMWRCPPLKPLWGDNFSPANTEIGEGVRAATDANEAGLITKVTAGKFVAPYFGVENPETEVEEAAKEAADRAQEAMENMPLSEPEDTTDDASPGAPDQTTVPEEARAPAAPRG